MKIAIRMDDISPDMDWEKFQRAKEICDRAGVKPLLGLVPENRDPNLAVCTPREDFWEQMVLLQEAGWSMALHGMYHIYTTQKGGLFPLNLFSEFAGVPYEQQFSMLSEGAKILQEHGIHTTLFMAPAHSYDRNTLKALRKIGYTGLTDGFGSLPYKRAGLTFYPISFRLSQSLKKEKGYTTMVLHTGTMNDGDFAAFERRLLQPGRQTTFIDYSDYLAVEAKDRSVLGNGLELLLAALKRGLVRFL